ncbi:MAG: general transcription factor 3C polypeptide 3 [Amphiamblys sp. WSBS2006]|nr:MAG: general transcription factor 3C polypeptide 3 [Amphiamblys sp. WSBS2006]
MKIEDLLDDRYYRAEDEQELARTRDRFIEDEEILRRLEGEEKQTKKKKKKTTREEEEKIGEANSAYIQRDYPTAKRLFREIILSNPEIPEVYTTLSLLHEEEGDTERAIGFGLCEIRLVGGTAEKWRRFAELALKISQPEKAIQFFSRGIKLDPSDNEMIFTRAMLCAERRKYELGVKGLLVLLKREPRNEAFLKEFQRMVENFGVTQDTLRVLESIMEANPSEVTFRYLETCLDGYGQRKRDEKIVEVYQAYSERAAMNFFLAQGSLSPSRKELLLAVPSAAVLGYVCSLVRMKKTERATEVVLEQRDAGREAGSIEEMVQCMVTYGWFEDALYVLGELESTPRAVLLRAQCHHKLRFLGKAIEGYRRVLQADPGNEKATVGLGLVLVETGYTDVGVELVSQWPVQSGPAVRKEARRQRAAEGEFPIFGEIVKRKRSARRVLYDESEIRLLHGKVLVYESSGMHAEAVDEMLYIASELMKVFFESEVAYPQRNRELTVGASRKRGEYEIRDNVSTLYGLRTDEWFHLGLLYGRGLIRGGSVRPGVEVLKHTGRSILFHGDREKALLLLMVSMAAYKEAADMWGLRNVCGQIYRNSFGWFRNSVFVFFMRKRQHMRLLFDNKIKRRVIKECTYRGGWAEIFMRGSLHTATWKYFKGIQAYRMLLSRPTPLLHLSLGVGLVLYSVQDKVKRRNSIVAEGFLFLFEYHRKRIEEGHVFEANYNIGRMFQQLGMVECAIEYYRKALGSIESTGDYVFECGYNLSRIFDSLGCFEYARETMERFCVI